MANVYETTASSNTNSTTGPAASGSIVSTLPVIMGTVVLALVVALVGGDKALRPFLWLILLSMVVVNAGTISAKLNNIKGVLNP